jgi:hypothetical protein
VQHRTSSFYAISGSCMVQNQIVVWVQTALVNHSLPLPKTGSAWLHHMSSVPARLIMSCLCSIERPLKVVAARVLVCRTMLTCDCCGESP